MKADHPNHYGGKDDPYEAIMRYLQHLTDSDIHYVKLSLGDDGAVTTKATPAFTATDCALFVFDTTEDGEITFVSNGGTADANADATDFDIAADTFFVVEVVGRGPTDTTGDNVSGYINGQYVGSGNITGASTLTPWAYVETLTTATRTFTVDYWAVVGPRTAAWGGTV